MCHTVMLYCMPAVHLSQFCCNDITLQYASCYRRLVATFNWNLAHMLTWTGHLTSIQKVDEPSVMCHIACFTVCLLCIWTSSAVRLHYDSLSTLSYARLPLTISYLVVSKWLFPLYCLTKCWQYIWYILL
jgi:hypothetical protein